MRTIIYIGVIFIIFLGIFYLTNEHNVINNDNEAYIRITGEQAKQILEQDETAVVIDVRTEEEYLEGHIPNSILIPVDEIKANIEGVITDKETTIILYCRTGNRTQAALKTLMELGYKNVYDLGGLRDWPYEIEK